MTWDAEIAMLRYDMLLETLLRRPTKEYVTLGHLDRLASHNGLLLSFSPLACRRLHMR